MSLELIIQDRNAELTARALSSVSHFIVGPDRIITEDAAFTVLVQTAKKVERVVGHKTATVKRVRKQLRKAFGSRLLLVLLNVHSDASLEVLVQRLDVCHHTGGSQDARVSEFCRLRVRARKNVVAR